MTKQIQITNPFADRLISLCDQITDYFGWNLKKETKEWHAKGSRRITQDEDIRKSVYKAKSEANLNWGLGITSLYERIPSPDRWGIGFVNFFGYSSADQFTLERIEHQKELVLIVFQIVELYNEWKAKEFDPAINSITDKLNLGDKKVSMYVITKN